MKPKRKVREIPSAMTFDLPRLSMVKKVKVAAYARVSTEKEEQEDSFERQVSYYTTLINSKPEWKFGGIYVPANQAVIHQFAREMMAGCGKMILGSDSHTRYGALGTMAVGEGGPEIVKQLLGDSYDIPYPKVTLVYLTGTPNRGVGPHDVALALCGAVYKDGFVKNHVLEFAGPGVSGLSMDYRIGIDVMTTETACLSSIWQTDGKVDVFVAGVGTGGTLTGIGRYFPDKA